MKFNPAGISETHFLGAAGMPGVTALLPIRELYEKPARAEGIGAGALIDCLDVSILQDRVLGPILGIEDPRVDARMRYLSGAFDMNQLQSHCRAHDLIGFAVYPTAIEDLMAVADAGEVMPPKSTWFEAKLRSGVFIRMR